MIKECNLKGCMWCENLEHYHQYRLQKTICQWCEKNKINYTFEQYLIKGNQCGACATKINKIMEEKLEQIKANKEKTKQEQMDAMGALLDEQLTEEEAQQVVDEMMILHHEIKYEKIKTS